jgi:hypothetical protein
MTISLPAGSVLAGIVTLADPAVNCAGGDVYVPLERLTVPVGVAVPAGPLTVMVVVRGWVAVMVG